MVLLDSREGRAEDAARSANYDEFGGGAQGGAAQRTQSRPQPAAFDTDLDDDVPF